MAMRRGPRLQVGSAAWIAEERDSALNIARSEIEEFSFSARNEIDWLNEHMAEVFSETQMNVAELFKTPGKLRGKTPRTVRKAEPSALRIPLADIFSATTKGAPSPFAMSNPSEPRSPRIRVAEDQPQNVISQPASPAKPAVIHPPVPVEPRAPTSLADSGYHGSQSQDVGNFSFDKDVEMADSPELDTQPSNPVALPGNAPAEQKSHSTVSGEETFQSANEGQTQHITAYVTANIAPTPSAAIAPPTSPIASRSRLPVMSPRSPSPKKLSPVRHSPQKPLSSPQKPMPASPQKEVAKQTENLNREGDGRDNASDDLVEADGARSPSDASSPIRPIVRKSSLNFASLPAREPLASKKSLGGARMSRTSQLDLSRPGHYNRQTGGKSLGNAIRQGAPEDDKDVLGVEDGLTAEDEDTVSGTATYSKTYTQRLQDQISMLGKAQSTGPRASKSLANLLPPSQTLPPASQPQSLAEPPLDVKKSPPPKPKQSFAAPGAFPDEDEDEDEEDWIAAPKNTATDRGREEKEREKQAEKEIQAAKHMAEQMEKLERAREKEREKARAFAKEQEKIAAMERQAASQKEQEKAAQALAQAQSQAQEFRTPGPPARSATRSPPKATRATPRKTKGQMEGQGQNTVAPSEELDVDMTDAPGTVPPQSIPRPATASSMRAQNTKRPVRPTKEALAKSKQAPTVIRVNTTSSQQSQFHPSNSVLAATLQETLGQQQPPARPLNGKASQASVHTKSSLQSLKSSVSSASRPKALELAAKRKEQEEREAQRKREAKLELERKRAAQEEERKQEQRRKLEAERLKEEERKAAQARKAAIEKAKQTKAPPPAVRSQPNGPPDYSAAEKGGPMRPPSRLGSTVHQEGRLVNTVLSSTAKASGKRPLQQDLTEDSFKSQQQQRAMPAFPSKEAKRMRMSEEFDEDIDMVDSHTQRIIGGAPVRPSGGFKKDLPSKSIFANGYANAPSAGASRDLFKATVTAQHHSQAKAAHPLDMAQVSKGAIPFAQNPNHTAGAPSHKTPGRPAGGAPPKSAKSAKSTVARSSPRFQNGESIELPDIQTDDDSDDDDDDGHAAVAAWADSPALKAALLAQERVDPMQVFGPPAPLNMEEVFSKTKDRWHKFRARTSSANWSGTDRLTEEDIRKDMAARDKMRREGGWSYDLGREMA